MGTRASVGIIIEGEYKATYCHFDGYYGGVGDEVVNFINGMNEVDGWDQFEEKVKQVIMVTDKDTPTEEDVSYYTDNGRANFTVGGPSDQPTWYQLLRESQGAEGLDMIYNGVQKHMLDDGGFIYDSLFCEYAYILNLDTMEFEIYRGFQKEAQEGNRFQRKEGTRNEYHPCKLMKTMPLVTSQTNLDSPENVDIKLSAIALIGENKIPEAIKMLHSIKKGNDIYNDWYPKEENERMTKINLI